MNIAMTGGSGFVGRHIARALAADHHHLALIARGFDRGLSLLISLPGTKFYPMNLDSPRFLAQAFAGCNAVVHCAGINRERGEQTYQRVHIEGTRHVIEAAREAGVSRIVLFSFLRARPGCGSAYHESKWAAEEIVRHSGLDFTVLKCGVIYGRGDHMLDHLSRGFHTFPVFGFVGFKDKPIRPNAVEDVARIVKACVVEGSLSGKTVALVGPEQLTLRAAVRRVARVAGKHPIMFPLPVWLHYRFAYCLERTMPMPMVWVAQVRMLSEGLAEPSPPCDPMPPELAPRIGFTDEQIRAGLPAPGGYGLQDLGCCNPLRGAARERPSRWPFFEMP